MPRPKTPEPTSQEMRERYQRGESPRKIAAALRVGTTTVRRYARDLPRHRQRQLPPETIASIPELRRKGRSREHVAQTLNVSATSVRRYELNQNNAATRRRTPALAKGQLS